MTIHHFYDHDRHMELIRNRMAFSLWLCERSNIKLKSELGEFLFNRWLKGKCLVLRSNQDRASVTFHESSN